MKRGAVAGLAVLGWLSAAAPAGAATSPEVAALAEQCVGLDQRGEILPALDLCRQARSLAPSDPDLALLEGRLLGRVGAVAQAVAAFQEARTLGSSDPAAWLLGALLLRDAGRTDEAIELLDDALEKGRKTPEIFEQQVFLRLQKGDVPRARVYAEEGRGAWPAHPGLTLALGLALAREPGSEARAVELLKEALTKGAPEPAKIHLELGSLLLSLGQNDAALEHLRAVVGLAPELPEAHYRLATALRASGDPEGASQEMIRFQELSRQRDAQEWHQKELGTRLNEAQDSAAANRLAQALAQVEALVRDAPEMSRAHTLKAKVLFSLGRRDEAAQSIHRACELAPFSAENHFLEGLFLHTLGHDTEAEPALRRALALAPDLAEAHELLGTVAAELGRPEEAVGHYEGETGSRLDEIEKLATQNQLLDALEKLDALIAESPALGRAHGLRAKLLFSLGRREPALEAIRRACELSPGVAEYRHLEGLFLVSLGRGEEAEVSLRRALDLDPAAANAHELLGKVLDDLGRTSEAVEHYRRAQALGSKSTTLSANLDAALDRLGQGHAEAPP